MAEPKPLEITLRPRSQARAAGSLLSWIQNSHDYRASLQEREIPPASGTLGGGEVILAGVFAPATLAGLFQIVKLWISSQRSRAEVEVEIPGRRVTVTLSGDFNPTEAAVRIIQMAERIDSDGAPEDAGQTRS
jgi:hypothetical protein